MKRIVIALIVIGAAVLSAAQAPGPAGGRAQGAGQGKGGPGAGMNRMREAREKIFAQLNLTKDQKAQIKKIDTETAAKMKELMEKAKGDRSAMREQARPIMQDANKKTMAVLTKEQQKKFKQLMQEYREKMQKEHGPGGAAGGKGGKGGGL